MSLNESISKVRQWHNNHARWMLKHFNILFFELILIIIFFVFLYNTSRTIDISHQTQQLSVTEELLLQQTTNGYLIIILMLLNSFWMLYIFNEVIRLRGILKDISFYQSHRKPHSSGNS